MSIEIEDAPLVQEFLRKLGSFWSTVGLIENPHLHSAMSILASLSDDIVDCAATYGVRAAHFNEKYQAVINHTNVVLHTINDFDTCQQFVDQWNQYFEQDIKQTKLSILSEILGGE